TTPEKFKRGTKLSDPERTDGFSRGAYARARERVVDSANEQLHGLGIKQEVEFPGKRDESVATETAETELTPVGADGDRQPSRRPEQNPPGKKPLAITRIAPGKFPAIKDPNVRLRLSTKGAQHGGIPGQNRAFARVLDRGQKASSSAGTAEPPGPDQATLDALGYGPESSHTLESDREPANSLPKGMSEDDYKKESRKTIIRPEPGQEAIAGGASVHLGVEEFNAGLRDQIDQMANPDATTSSGQ
ncbi:MAG: hypothetical protein AAB425_00505, partial [Bdellovibrionota bacterium]